MAPVIRDLGGLKGEVKNAGECRGYEGTQGFKGFGKEPCHNLFHYHIWLCLHTPTHRNCFTKQFNGPSIEVFTDQ